MVRRRHTLEHRAGVGKDVTFWDSLFCLIAYVLASFLEVFSEVEINNFVNAEL